MMKSPSALARALARPPDPTKSARSLRVIVSSEQYRFSKDPQTACRRQRVQINCRSYSPDERSRDIGATVRLYCRIGRHPAQVMCRGYLRRTDIFPFRAPRFGRSGSLSVAGAIAAQCRIARWAPTGLPCSLPDGQGSTA